MDTSQPLSPLTLVTANGLMNKVAMVGGGSAQAQQHGLHSLRLT